MEFCHASRAWPVYVGAVLSWRCLHLACRRQALWGCLHFTIAELSSKLQSDPACPCLHVLYAAGAEIWSARLRSQCQRAARRRAPARRHFAPSRCHVSARSQARTAARLPCSARSQWGPGTDGRMRPHAHCISPFAGQVKLVLALTHISARPEAGAAVGTLVVPTASGTLVLMHPIRAHAPTSTQPLPACWPNQLLMPCQHDLERA